MFNGKKNCNLLQNSARGVPGGKKLQSLKTVIFKSI